MMVNVFQGRGNESRHTALHVDGAASVDLAVADVAGERRDRPDFFIADGHDVGVAREG